MRIEDFAGSSHGQQYARAYEFLAVVCQELGIPVPNMSIHPSPYGCHFNGDLYYIHINPSQLDIVDGEPISPLMVIAHEARHAYQKAVGWMTTERKVVQVNALLRVPQDVLMWNGVAYPDFHLNKHHTLPWEIDAIAYEEQVAARLKVKPFPRPERDRDRRIEQDKRVAEYIERIQQSA